MEEINPFEVIKNLAFAIVGVGAALALVILIGKSLYAFSKGAAQVFVGALAFALIILLFTNGQQSLELLERLRDGLASAIGLG
ncbi:hypothetical protein [Desmospora activa]|uniref:Uncharacterized protein n=1 Tax=Desmospora activa DSM 45169 TaxID=1121389 RepID=A0A2T4YZP3_9BACL|nr:hypothetical protein [Desmospora activa]PTM52713.1 hypothetical protein C8J48_3706 [Desmospora activa DSM 45169]